MKRYHNLFGTDGIRGLANSEPMNADTVRRIGMAAGLQLVAPLAYAQSPTPTPTPVICNIEEQGVPGFPMLFGGSVTIAGTPAPDGIEIFARVSDSASWKCPP